MENPSPEAVKTSTAEGLFIYTNQNRKGDFFMANSKEELKLIRMNEVEATAIDWLWYP
ncbi:MAG: hypothetical protein FWG00_02525 [Coriobacteriia bacterium]|nr:hypothetical protein [Coriobacteriia bacterium]